MFALISAILGRFGVNRSAQAGVEFAIIAPVMLFSLMMSFDLVDLMQANKRVENVSASISDVISRDSIVSDEEMTDIFASIDALLFPTLGTALSVRVTSITVDNRGQATVVWSEGRGGFAPRVVGAAITIPAGLLVPNCGLVLAETQISYRAPLGILSPTAWSLRQDEYRRPRVADPVLRMSED
jgi:Flp pilus assembly protein TadG